MGENIGKNISKNLSGKQCPGMLAARQKLLIMLNNLQQMHLNMLQKEQFKKTGEAIGDLIGNKIAYTRVSKISQENNSEIVTNDNNKEIPKDIYIYI